jgi:tol-pal system protein YbgF
VPSLPPKELSLPPEPAGLGLPPLEGASKAASASRPAGQRSGQSAGQASPPAGTAASSAASASSAPAAAASPKGEEAAYKAALRLALSGKSAQSIGQFQAFLQSYPQGRYAPNATYWIGEGLYAQGRYGEALDQFRKVESGWPRHHKTADALLKAGMSLSRLGDRQGAAQAYGEVLRRFPHSEAAGLVRARGLAR